MRSDFTNALGQGVSDPELKRKAIGKEFITVFKDFAESLVARGIPKPKFLVQGTLYPDVIESCPPPGSGQKHSHTIKSHHNVGGLPKDLQFLLIEPLRELFKVRPGLLIKYWLLHCTESGPHSAQAFCNCVRTR